MPGLARLPHAARSATRPRAVIHSPALTSTKSGPAPRARADLTGLCVYPRVGFTVSAGPSGGDLQLGAPPQDGAVDHAQVFGNLCVAGTARGHRQFLATLEDEALTDGLVPSSHRNVLVSSTLDTVLVDQLCFMATAATGCLRSAWGTRCLHSNRRFPPGVSDPMSHEY